LPRLAPLEICEHTKKFNHVTQEMADRMLGIAYERRRTSGSLLPRNIVLHAAVQMRSLLREVVDAEYPDQNNMWAAMYLYDGAILRIFHICGVGQWSGRRRFCESVTAPLCKSGTAHHHAPTFAAFRPL
jgi:hypothetical protein